MNASSKTAKQTFAGDNVERFETLMERPKISWPTLALLFAAFALFGYSSYAYITGALPLFWAIFNNSIASYMAFTVSHEASHSSVSTNRTLNDWIGRIAMLLLEPTPIFLSFRTIHMTHHKFTNDRRDPDMHAGSGLVVAVQMGDFGYGLFPLIFSLRDSKR